MPGFKLSRDSFMQIFETTQYVGMHREVNHLEDYYQSESKRGISLDEIIERKPC